MHFHQWLIWGAVNGLIIYVASFLFPGSVVLGNATVSVLSAIVLAALGLTLVISLLPVILRQLGVAKISENNRYLIYALVNTMVVWFMSRAAFIFGFGLDSKFTAVILGVILTIGQYLYWEKGLKKIT